MDRSCAGVFLHLALAAKGGRHLAPIRILVADDHQLVRLGICRLLSQQPDFHIVGEASDGVEAITKAKEHQPDVVVLDITMPQLNGIAATPGIKDVAPHAEVLIVTDHDSPEFACLAFTAGARGFIPKSDITRELAAAVRKVNRGESFLCERLKELCSARPPSSSAA